MEEQVVVKLGNNLDDASSAVKKLGDNLDGTSSVVKKIGDNLDNTSSVVKKIIGKSLIPDNDEPTAKIIAGSTKITINLTADTGYPHEALKAFARVFQGL